MRGTGLSSPYCAAANEPSEVPNERTALLAVRPKFSCWKRSLLAPSNLLITGASIAIAIFPAFAYAQSGSPFDTGFTNLQNLFTGTIAKVASLIAIVIGGYSLAHGEPGAK